MDHGISPRREARGAGGGRMAAGGGSPRPQAGRFSYVDGMRLRLELDALDPRAEIPQAFVDALVAAVDLADVADLAAAAGGQRRDQHRHAGADVGRLDAPTAQSARPGDDRAVRVAEHDVGA